MRQFFADVPIHPGAGNGAQKGDKHDKKTCADLGKNRSGASAGHGPAKPENEPSVNLPAAEFFIVKLYGFPVNGFDAVLFNEPDKQRAQHDACTDYPVHVERLHAKHFLHAKPGNDFGFYEGNAENESDNGIFEIVPPGVLQLRLINAHGIDGAHFKIGVLQGRGI